MSKSFNYILAHFKLDATTFCNMMQSYYRDPLENHYQRGQEMYRVIARIALLICTPCSTNTYIIVIIIVVVIIIINHKFI